MPDPKQPKPPRRRNWRAMIFRRLIAGGVLLGLFLAVALSGWFESMLFYYPSRRAVETPPGYRDVWIETDDGVRLHAWFVPARGLEPGGQAPVVVHCHGNAGNVADHEAFSSFLADRGISVLIFDYRGYGQSTNRRRTRAGLVTDSLAAADFARAMPETDPDRVGVFGYSLGGTFASVVAMEREWVRGLCIAAGFRSWPEIAGFHGGRVARWLTPGDTAAEENVAKLGGRPLLVVHGSEDFIVPVKHGRAIAEAARDAGVPVDFLERPGLGHNEVVAFDRVSRDAVGDFFVRLFELDQE